MLDDANLCNGVITFYDDEEEKEIQKEVECINIEICEDIHEVEGVSRIVKLDIIVDGERLDELSDEFYNKYCDREFFGESFEQKRDAANLISDVTGVSIEKINVSFE